MPDEWVDLPPTHLGPGQRMQTYLPQLIEGVKGDVTISRDDKATSSVIVEVQVKMREVPNA